MDVKGAKALRERLEQAARSVDHEGVAIGDPKRGPGQPAEGATPQSHDGRLPVFKHFDSLASSDGA
jgi:hypothetical protein